VKQEKERLDGPKEEEGKKAPPTTQTTKVVKRTIPLNMLGMMNKFVNFLSINGQLPAIFFTLSRKKCNVLANQVY
jgi:superfamily II RNA helicase